MKVLGDRTEGDVLVILAQPYIASTDEREQERLKYQVDGERSEQAWCLLNFSTAARPIN